MHESNPDPIVPLFRSKALEFSSRQERREPHRKESIRPPPFAILRVPRVRPSSRPLAEFMPSAAMHLLKAQSRQENHFTPYLCGSAPLRETTKKPVTLPPNHRDNGLQHAGGPARRYPARRSGCTRRELLPVDPHGGRTPGGGPGPGGGDQADQYLFLASGLSWAAGLWVGSEDFRRRVRESKFGRMPRFAQSDTGYIALQGDHGQVSFRNVKIRPVSESR